MNLLVLRIKEDLNMVLLFLARAKIKFLQFNKSFDENIKQDKLPLKIFMLFSAFYITLVSYFMNSPVFFDSVRTAKSLISSGFFFILFYFLLKILCLKTKGVYFKIPDKKELHKNTIIYTAAICFIAFLFLYLINFPGLITTDNESQWSQIQSFTFNNWHPAIHTFIMWLLTRIINHYGFIIFCQIIVFSFSIGILIATLEAWGFSRAVQICLTLFFILNPMVKNILMFAYKDTLFTILFSFTITFLINTYFSGGKWLSSIKNVFKLSFCITLLSIVRHNGILLTLPLVLALLFFYIKKSPKLFLLIPFTAVMIFLIRFPLYTALNVHYPNNTYSESLGVPMTIMCDVLIKNPEALPENARKLLLDFDSETGWTKKYELGNFSSVKGKFDGARIISTIPKEEFFRMFMATVMADPYNSFQAFRNHSAFVWEIFTAENNFISAPWKRDIARETNIVKKLFMYATVFYDNAITSILPLGWVLSRNGWHILILILAGVISLYRCNTKVFLFIVPVLFYTLTTMLLLSASDFRYFQSNTVVIPPIVLVLLSRKQSSLA
jgi:hypothetical protein